MRKLSIIAALVTGLYGAQASAANEFDIRLNDDVISAGATALITPQAAASVGFTYSEPSGQIGEIGAEMVNPQGVHTLSIGGKYLFSWVDDETDNGAIAFGLKYRLDLAPMLSFRVEGDYSPSVLAFDELDQYSRVDANVNFLAMPTVELFVGWREIRFEFENRSEAYIFEEGMYAGARFLF